MKKKKAAAKTEGEGECFAAGPLRASGRIRAIQPWFAGLVPSARDFFRATMRRVLCTGLDKGGMRVIHAGFIGAGAKSA